MDATTNPKPKTLTEMLAQILGYWSTNSLCEEKLTATYLELCDRHNEFYTEEYREKIRAALKALRALLDWNEDLVLALDAKLGQAINNLEERPLPDRLITIEDVNEQSLFREVKKEVERRKQGWSEEEILFPGVTLPAKKARMEAAE